MLNILKNNLLKRSKLKELKAKVKYKNWLKSMSFFLQAIPPLQIKYSIIDNNFLSYNLVKYYVSPFWPKRSNRKCCKSFIIVRGLESKKPTK
jgi:hypothetical protein